MFVILPNFQPSKEFKRFETNMDISGFYLCCFQEDLDLLADLMELGPMLYVGVTNNRSHTLSEAGPRGARPGRT